MSAKLIAVVEAAIAGAVQNYPKEASVIVQFAAGDFERIREALAEAKAELAPAPAPEPEPESTEGGDHVA